MKQTFEYSNNQFLSTASVLLHEPEAVTRSDESLNGTAASSIG